MFTGKHWGHLRSFEHEIKTTKFIIEFYLVFLLKGIINPKNQFIMQNKFLSSRTLLDLFLKSRSVFSKEIAKIGSNKNAKFFTDIFLFLQTIKLSAKIRSSATFQTLLYHYTRSCCYEIGGDTVFLYWRILSS